MKSERSVAGNLGICHVNLNRCIKIVRATEFGASSPKCGYRPHTRIFDVDQEIMLATFSKNCADMYLGLSTMNVRKLAFKFAKKLNLRMPAYWTENEFAGINWFVNFFKCNPTLSIRQPEATSSSRSMNFNQVNVNIFIDKYDSLLTKHKFEAFQFFNIDETGTITVQNPGKIVAQKGKKQIGAITSQNVELW